jgi:hypothetical protein
MPFAPCLEPGFQASKVVARKRKNDAGIRPAGKHAKVSGRKPTTLKAPAAPKGIGAASSKVASLKVAPSHMKYMPKASAAPRASAPPEAGEPMKAVMSKNAATPAVSKVGVLRISTGMKSPSVEPSPAPNGK